MYELFISLTVLTIVSQLFHNYEVFHSFSNLNGRLKAIQAVIFCGIISVSIFAFVLINKPILALFGALIEIVINILYYGREFWKNGFPVRKNRKASILSYWRQNWGRYLFSIIIPMLIYIFAEQIIELK